MTSNEETSTKNNHLNDMIIIWLDETLKNPEKLLTSQRPTLLLSYIKSIQTFTDILECENYINKMEDLSIFLVVSGSLGEKIISNIHHLPQITFIYVFCVNKDRHELWTESFSKIRGVFIDDLSLSTQLKNDVCSLSNINFPFGLFDSTQQTLQDLNQEQASFMWFHLIIEVLFRLPRTSEAKTEMISEFQENQAQLEKLAEFEEVYDAKDAIRWYTDNTFVFRLFNRAFRKQDFETIFKYRYFLVDLYSQLSSLHNQQYQNRSGSLIVFRGQMMCQEELMKLKQNVGHLISINTFFSTSTSCHIAAKFSGNGEHLSNGIVSVIFQITVDLSVPNRPFANISQLSRIEDEREILFSLDTVFQIDSVELDINSICFVKLSWTDGTNKKLKEMKQLLGLLDYYTKQNIGDHPSILTFGLFLSKMGFTQHALRFYMYLKNVLPIDHQDRGVLYNNLGEVLRKLKYFNQARHHFELALEYYTDTISFFHPLWAILHNNIALLNSACDRPKQALKFYHSALLVITRLSQENDSEMTFAQELLTSVYYGMGSVYLELNQIHKSIQLYEKALEIELRILPSDHPTLIESYLSMAEVNTILTQYSKAIQNYEEAMRIARKNLLTNDWKFLSLHLNIAILAYYKEENISKTIMHCSQALCVLERLTFSLTNADRLNAYEVLEILYTNTDMINIAVRMWQRFIDADKNRSSFEMERVDRYNLLIQMDRLEISCRHFHENPKEIISTDNKQSIVASISLRKAITRCEIADYWRAKGYIKEAIAYYTWLLGIFSTTYKSEYSRLHKSRLHNNLAASYQDLNDNHMALYHYQLALDILTSDEEHISMQTAITHYNIALIHMNLTKFDQAQKHLHQSLEHFLRLSKKPDIKLDIEIFNAFAKIYEQCNEWHKARDYYQRIVDQIRQDTPDHRSLIQYEKRLQHTIDKISCSSNNRVIFGCTCGFGLALCLFLLYKHRVT